MSNALNLLMNEKKFVDNNNQDIQRLYEKYQRQTHIKSNIWYPDRKKDEKGWFRDAKRSSKIYCLQHK